MVALQQFRCLIFYSEVQIIFLLLTFLNELHSMPKLELLCFLVILLTIVIGTNWNHAWFKPLRQLLILTISQSGRNLWYTWSPFSCIWRFIGIIPNLSININYMLTIWNFAVCSAANKWFPITKPKRDSVLTNQLIYIYSQMKTRRPSRHSNPLIISHDFKCIFVKLNYHFKWIIAV